MRSSRRATTKGRGAAVRPGPDPAARCLPRDRRGVSGLEFALIGPLFLLLTCAVTEIGLELLTQVALDQGVDIAARQIQIGNATTAAAFAADVCGHVSTLIGSCASSIQLYATSGASFSGLAVATVGSNGVLSPATYSPGGSGADVLVQVAYTRPYLFGPVGAALGRKTYTLVSTVALQSEPY